MPQQRVTGNDDGVVRMVQRPVHSYLPGGDPPDPTLRWWRWAVGAGPSRVTLLRVREKGGAPLSFDRSVSWTAP
jgi:hypothetical protein